MNLFANPWMIIGALVASLALFGGGYWKGHHDADQSAMVKAQASKIERQNEALTALRTRVKLAEEQNDKLAAAEAARIKDLKDEREKNAKLRAAVDAGRVRLHVNGVCSNALPEARPSGGVDHGETCELAAAARQDYYALRDGIAHQRQQLLACQDRLQIISGGKD